ncbi:gluconeogenesis factor YvcK family protein [Miltoncostaea marina]|uniref:gluconeogenesis factor YvcK family protein n=1 Tax=Miltoncostaea marina TaxID=2843215 RepID=UPI001C3CB9C9|nr:gluconeogenesis factor YvcK family protein [Miltoncostaea marina]
MSRLPRITALGGGTGLASLLRGLKRAPLDITAVVTVADDGGSSGRLRRELGVLPPGDVRNCLVALADDESLMGTLFQHRFADGGLSGHPFGNIFLAALAEVTGSFDLAIQECSRVLKIRGRVLPSTLDQIRLRAERADGTIVAGESTIGAGVGPCRRVWLEPEPTPHAPALRAIEEADLVLLGPGSLFTSVLPHLAVPEVAAALRRVKGPRVYVCNVMTQPGETDGLDAAAHVERVLEAAPGGVDTVLVHDGALDPEAAAAYAAEGQEPVVADVARLAAMGVRVVAGAFAEEGRMVRHSPPALAAAVIDLVRETGAP